MEFQGISFDPFLRRLLSLHSVLENSIEILHFYVYIARQVEIGIVSECGVVGN